MLRLSAHTVVWFTRKALALRLDKNTGVIPVAVSHAANNANQYGYN